MKRIIFLSFIINLLFVPVYADTPIEEGKFSLQSPSHTTYSFLYYLQQDSFEPEKAAKTLYPVTTEQNKEELAINLKQVLDGRGLFVYFEDIPSNNNHIDSLSGKEKFVLFASYPEIYLEKKDDKWYFSRETVRAIPDLHRRLYPYGTSKLLNMLPKVSHRTVIGLEIWQHIAIIIIIFIAFVIQKVSSFIFDKVLKRIVNNLGSENIDENYIHKVSVPLSMLFAFMMVKNLTPLVQLSVVMNKYIMLLLDVLIPFMVAVAIYKMVDILAEYLAQAAARTEGTLDDQLVPLVRKTLKLFVLVSGFLFILQNLNVNITALLAGLSIGGLAFALAAQDTIKNLFGSLMIFIDKPFQVGDWINFDGNDGTVEEVGFRSTRVRTFKNSLVYIPNGKLADLTVDNYGMRRYRRFFTTISITYDTPPDLIDAYVEGLREIVINHPQVNNENFHIYLNDFGGSSLNILFYIFFDVPTWGDELKARHEVIGETIRLAETLNVRFAFPTRTLHMETFPEKRSLMPDYTNNPEDFKKQVRAYFEKKQVIN